MHWFLKQKLTVMVKTIEKICIHKIFGTHLV